MWNKLSCAFAAFCAAVIMGGEFFVLMTALDWAILEEIVLTGNAMMIGAAIAALPSLAVSIWIARSAYLVEMGAYEPGEALAP